MKKTILITGATAGIGRDAALRFARQGHTVFATGRRQEQLDVLSDADVRKQFDTNVFGLHAVTRAFVPQMRERGAGRIIHVGSMGGKITFPFMGAYNATKYALESISDAMRLELRPFGISV